MPNEALIKAINTPNQNLCEKLEKEGEEITDNNQKIKAYFLGQGGNGKAYLYRATTGEYRVKKILFSCQEAELKRKKESFNYIYRTVYQGELSSLATAEAEQDANSMVLDMPYLRGDEYYTSALYPKEIEDKCNTLLKFFKVNGFFITDYDLPGNIVIFFDSTTGKQYILVRDVDLMGLRADFERDREQSITYSLLQKTSENNADLVRADFNSVLTYHQAKQEENPLETEFRILKMMLLEKLASNSLKTEELKQATEFKQLCFIVGQKKPLHFFSRDEGFTKTLDLLVEIIIKNKDQLWNLLNHSSLDLSLDKTKVKYDLLEIGWRGKKSVYSLADPRLRQREKNLRFVYSIKAGEPKLRKQLTQLRCNMLIDDFATAIRI